MEPRRQVVRPGEVPGWICVARHLRYGPGWSARRGSGLEFVIGGHPRPSVVVYTAVLTVAPERTFDVLLVRRDGSHHGQEWALPGTFLHEEETLADAVLRSLEQKAGLRGTTPRQLRVFDDPNRDDRGWVLSVAHVVVLPWETVSSVVEACPDGVSLRPVTEASGLPFDHDAMVRLAVTELQAAHREQPDPEGLLSEPFTLRQLRKLHETVLDERLVPDTFRRHVLPQLRDTGRTTEGTVGRPATLYAREHSSALWPPAGGGRRS